MEISFLITPCFERKERRERRRNDVEKKMEEHESER